jgi:hypothetical protein
MVVEAIQYKFANPCQETKKAANDKSNSTAKSRSANAIPSSARFSALQYILAIAA